MLFSNNLSRRTYYFMVSDLKKIFLSNRLIKNYYYLDFSYKSQDHKAAMDQQFQNGIFSDFQRQQLSQSYILQQLPELTTPRMSQIINIETINLQSRRSSLEMDQISVVQLYPDTRYKAYNPMQMIQRMAPQKQKQYMRIASYSKNFNGLQFFFQTQDNDVLPQNEQTFLSGINQTVFGAQHQPKSGQLNRLFSTYGTNQTQKQHIQTMIYKLKGKMFQSQQKCFNSIMLNKTIGPTFYQHFQNFSFVSNPVNFVQDLEVNLMNFINHAKRLKGPGGELIFSIYDFWIKTFKDFVNQIWKYSSKYTLDFFKKQKNSGVSDCSQSAIKKQTSKQSKQKRKNWGADQLHIIQKIIESNFIFSQNKLKQLSEQLGRSVNSISSKIQKIIKSRKGQQFQQDSLLKKTIQVLKLSPQGLNKDTIIQKINEYYQMGYNGQWQKSVGQLLSSRKQFNKIKGKYKLLDGQSFLRNTVMQEQNNERLTFRDKVIRCFLKFQAFEADLKSLIQMYISIYGEQQSVGSSNQERIKSIQSSISKTLSRYQIFDASNSKTIYQYGPNPFGTIQKQNYQGQQIDKFINL